jgi:hypothetical protein
LEEPTAWVEMLAIHRNKPNRYCDGHSRREFLRVGTLAAGMLTWPHWLRAVSHDSAMRSGKSIIMICLGGGPSHLDTYDMRPEAPIEYRGELRPVASRIAGMPMCELLPRQAEIADRLAVVRSMQWSEPCHQFFEMCTGFPEKAARPSMGALVNRFYSHGHPRLPRFVDLAGDGDKIRAEQPRYAGTMYRPFSPSGPGMDDLKLPGNISLERLNDRKQLLQSFDALRREVDQSGEFAGMDAFTKQAMDLVTSNAIRDALDISKEPEKLLAKYGDRNARYHYLDVEYGFDFESFVRARRLAEAGVPFISLSVGRWDHHCLVPSQGSIFYSYRTLLPLYDMAVAALVSDLHERGLSEHVAVVVWGEFGRTPRVNKTGGRDHWPAAGFALVAGGGLKMGQYIGETDTYATQPKTRPYGPQNLLATLYHVLGMNTANTVLNSAGRPMYLLDDRGPIRELI